MKSLFVCLFVCLSVCSALFASDLDEFKVKREETFEFASKPTLVREGDRVTISFETKSFCDVTIAVENSQGRIVRHLTSGVLGENAPLPLQKNSLKQAVVWDGKDDQGRYIDDLQGCHVRVSLGLRPRFERTLNWSPYKRWSNACPRLFATEEGIYMFEGKGSDFLKLFNHDGEYVRTIYPFPHGKLSEARGLQLHKFEQDGKELPVKHGFVQSSLLTSGTSAIFAGKYKFGTGYGADAMAIQGERIAITLDSLNRLATDGTTGTLELSGPRVSMRTKWHGYGGQGGGEEIVGPASIAFSPDGKSLYMTGYMWRESYPQQGFAWQGVNKIDFASGKQPELFVGDKQQRWEGGSGTDNEHFHVPTSVACDKQGRVYVTDYMNHRIQVFTPDGKHLKSIPARLPAKLLIDPRSGNLWVFTWPVIGITNDVLKKENFEWRKVQPSLTKYGPFENPRKLESMPLPITVAGQGFFIRGQLADVAVDWWADKPRLWFASRKYNISRIDVAWGGSGAYSRRGSDQWLNDGIQIFEEQDGKLEEIRNFAAEAKKEVVRVKPPDFSRQRLYVNPKNEKLYVGEDSGFGKSFFEMIEIDPRTGKISLLDLPFDCEDICFDINGLAYMRTDKLVVRYDPSTWREVPWDYGEEHKNVGFSSIGANRRTNVIGALPTPGQRPVCWNQGGMSISPKGHLIVSCCSRAGETNRKARTGLWERAAKFVEGKPYTPTIYPGRPRWQEVHVWDRHGKLIYEDAAPGTTILNGVFIDNSENIYLMACPNRVLDGKPFFNEMAGTILKLAPKKSKLISSKKTHLAVPLADQNRPDRKPDVQSSIAGRAWVEGAQWFYGGVGYGGFNTARAGGGCHCWNSHFTVDYFARSFAPELEHYSVAVLDSNGNLILRIGKYGNVEDGMPLIQEGGPASPRSIGGDEVALFHAPYLGVHSDRRLFISDGGNQRILSVKLDYHQSERIALSSVDR